jgi:HEAT repeat protein
MGPTLLLVLIMAPVSPFRDMAQAIEGIAEGSRTSSQALAMLRQKGKPALWALNEAAKRNAGERRGNLFEAMGRFDSQEAEAALMTEVRATSDEHGKAGALRGLAHLRAKSAIGPMLQAASSGSAVVREAAALALAEIGSTVDPKMWAMLKGPDAKARATAVAYFNIRNIPKQMDEVVTIALDDSAPAVQIQGLVLAAKRGRMDSLPRIADLAAGANAIVSEAAIDALVEAHSPAAIAKLAQIVGASMSMENAWKVASERLRRMDDPAFEMWIDGISDAPETRKKQLLQMLISSVTSEELDKLVDMTARPFKKRAEIANDVLAEIGERAEDTMITRAIGTEPSLRRAAMAYLKKRERGRVMTKLLAKAKVGQPLQRAGAIEAMSQIGGQEVAPELGAFVGDPAFEVRIAAAIVLGAWGDHDADKILTSSLKDSNATVRVAVVEALAKHLGSEVTQSLIDALSDPELNVRMAAISGLGQSDPRGIRALKAYLRQASPEERVAITRSVAASPLAEAQRLMIDLVTDKDKTTRESAAKAVGAQ